jgi:hypothetical protein
MIQQVFVGPSYRSQAITADAERTVNWYPEVLESAGAKTPAALYPTPGVQLLFTLADFPVRGMVQENIYAGGTATSYIWIVSGATLYQGTTARGLVTGNTGPSTFTSSGATGLQLMNLSGGVATIVDLTTGLITGTVSLSSQTCGYLSNRFLALNAATGALGMSNILDGMTWDAGNVVKRSAAGDPWQAMAVFNSQIWLLGAKTGEAWYDAGTSPQPFQMVPNSLFHMGISAIYSLCICADGLMWLGANESGQAIIWRATNYLPQRISNHYVERKIQSYATISDAVAYAYQEQGHTFYVLNFPTAGATWVWDVLTNVWHERGYWNADTMAYESSRTHTSTFASGVHYVGDRVTGAVYQSSVDLPLDVGNMPLRRLRIAPVLSDENQWLFHSQLNLDIQPGLGTATGQGQRPQAMLQWSNDGGQTWGNEHWRSAGAQGAFSTRIIWRKLGRARNRVYQLVATDPIPWRLVNAYVKLEEGTS